MEVRVSILAKDTVILSISCDSNPETLRISARESDISKLPLITPVIISFALLNSVNIPTYAVRFFIAVCQAEPWFFTELLSLSIWFWIAFTLFCICFSPLLLADILPSSLLAAERARFSSLSDVPARFFIALSIRSVLVTFCATAEL